MKLRRVIVLRDSVSVELFDREDGKVDVVFGRDGEEIGRLRALDEGQLVDFAVGLQAITP